jgi:hypothetical protein
MTKKKVVPTAPRRVYRQELMARTNWSEAWLRELIRRGKIPPGRRDYDKGREFWMEDVADAIVRGDVIPESEAA